jgi:RNA polymerase sigma-70 factor (ECF subfamily)
MESLSDISLVTQVAVLHNQKAFDQLVRKYQSPVRRFLLHLTLGNEALSDDLAQETFLKAYTHIAQFKAISSFSTWLFRIAYNVFYDEVRSRKQTDDLDSREVARMSALSGDAGLQMDLYQALAQLKEVERTCITLQLVDGHPIDKISDITGLPQNTVKSHLKRGKEKLTDYLKANGYDR